jgi:hypothetical protein
MINQEFIAKWAANIVMVLATVATAFDMVPMNKILFLTGCVLWTWVGVLWRQPSLWSLNLFCGSIYVFGFIVALYK